MNADAHPKKSRKPLFIGLAVLALAGAGGGRLWWLGQTYAETDNAFVAGHVHPVSARVAGVVTRVAVEDHAAVASGQPLVELDPADAQLQLARLKAQVGQIDAQDRAAQAQTQQASAQVHSAQAQTEAAQAVLRRQQQDVVRAEDLFHGPLRVIPRSTLDATVAGRDAQAADLAAKRAAQLAAQQQVLGGSAQAAQVAAQRAVLAVQIQDAEQQLGYLQIKAPSSGRVGKRTVEVGQRVQPGQQLLAVVEDGVWMTANFKETQLARMKPGQKAEVHIDALPGVVLHATVQSFSPASGAQFALLPPDNATGNFTRIVQRVPVKLVLDAKEAATFKDQLRPGLSARVAVDLRT